jgi:hypothetical protein
LFVALTGAVAERVTLAAEASPALRGAYVVPPGCVSRRGAIRCYACAVRRFKGPVSPRANRLADEEGRPWPTIDRKT